uniref:Uncharacterized protein n=1 Tax=uncultured alpha proteobacterium HF0070_17D04 TaxID=710805 RepID=E0XSA3_9PROT|nr:hypothetical protein [uncultured alpha proteobacterium HF0070_17D04]
MPERRVISGIFTHSAFCRVGDSPDCTVRSSRKFLNHIEIFCTLLTKLLT